MLAARAQCPDGLGDEKWGVGLLRAMWANALQSVAVQRPTGPGKVPVWAKANAMRQLYRSGPAEAAAKARREKPHGLAPTAQNARLGTP